MKAIVRKVNYRRGMVVFEKEDGDYGYFEILDSVDLEEEDIENLIIQQIEFCNRIIIYKG